MNSALKDIKISTPKYDETIPSNGQKVKLTPFRVGDEKTLLIASQSDNVKEMTNALKSVISNCVSPVNVDELATYDLEYLFLKLRAKSVGENTDIAIGCKKCKAMNEIKIDLETVIVEKNDEHENFIKIEENLGFMMKNVDLNDVVDIDINDPESLMNIIVLSIDSVYHGEEVIKIEHSDREDLKTLIESTTSAQFENFRRYFDTMPRLRKNVQFICGGCGHDNNQVLEGLASFF